MGSRKLSPLDATLLVMGGIFGVGIFFTPHIVAERAFEPWAFLCMWLFGGAIALCAAFTFAELGASFPKSGGWFVYLHAAYGPFPAFLFAWIVLGIVSTGAIAAMVVFCADMLHIALPSLVGEAGTASHRFTAAGIIVGVTAVALTGVKRAALLQNLCMLTKILVALALIVSGLVLYTPGPVAEAAALPAEVPERSLLAGMLASLLPVFFACGGWQTLGYVAPEVRDPERNVPRAIVWAVGLVVLLYLLLNTAFLRVLGLEGVAESPGFAAEVARRTLGEYGERLLSGGMAVSALGVCAVTSIVSPWLYVAMAREGLFFRRVGALHPETGVPTLALLLQGAIALVYFFAATLSFLVDATVFVEWFFHFLVALALLLLRRRPGIPRPFKSPLYPLAPVVYLSAAVLVIGSTLWQAEPELKYTGLGIVALGALAYRPWRWLMTRAG